jgi:DNA repair protein RadB
MEAVMKKELVDKIMTGSHDLNVWLEGGYEKEVITFFYGPAASGKSNFVLLAACHNAKKGKKVIFVDTEGSFSVDRVKQISHGVPEFILKNIVILKPTRFSEQQKAFSRILAELRSKNVGLIIIDSLTMLYRLELAEARKRGLSAVQQINAQLADQLRSLHEIARKQQISVLITGQVYSEFLSEEDWLAGKTARVGVVGGDVVKYWSKCIIELNSKGGKRKAIIRKHRSLPPKEISFEILNEGIRKRGWL